MNRPIGWRWRLLGSLVGAGLLQLAHANSPPDSSANSASAGSGDPPQWHLLQERCSKCHNSEDWAGGIAFDTMSPQDIPSDAETWEKAMRKLRGRLMPPPGNPQPDQQTIDSFVSWMEGELDHAASSQPSPGSVGIHRLNRTEYARDINAILGLKVDVKTLLPKDVSSDGFDNVAAVLRTSPAFLEQYIGAARAISRQAIGRATEKPSSREYRVPGTDQSEHIDGLPLGTRGGLLVEHYFPADGEYEFNIRDFFFGGAGYVTKIDDPHSVVMTVDDVPVFERSFGGPQDLAAVDKNQAVAADEMQSRFNHIRVRIKAGRHRIGVAFIQRSFAESDSPLQPIAMLPEMERVPTIPGVDVSGPFNVTGISDTESRKRIFICRPMRPEDEEPCAKKILANLAEQAFRRPVTDEDMKAPLAFYASGRQSGDFESGIESGLTAILSSTKFLFRAEPPPPNTGVGTAYALTDLQLASRLSFFLWSEGPDKALIDVAASGRLHDPKVLSEQVQRMLADPRSDSLVTNFAFQWLDVNRIDNIEPDPVLYPNFDKELRNGYREEIRLFLNSVLRSDRSVLDLLSSDETFLNERLAREYGIPNIQGAQFRPVRLTDPNRRGLLGKGAILMGTSYGNRTSPVLRGAWILENITGTPPESPPPGVNTTLKEAEPGQKVETVRDRLTRHRQNPSCNACHGVIDPLGFALENYDVVGSWRDRDLDAGVAIDSAGKLSSGIEVSGPSQLREALLRRPNQFVQTLTEKLMTFALGRAVTFEDMPTVRAIVRQSAGEGYRFASIVQGIVASPAFKMSEVAPTSPQKPQQKQATLGTPKEASLDAPKDSRS
jgi:mono/diheme cytochrome c family protein